VQEMAIFVKNIVLDTDLIYLAVGHSKPSSALLGFIS
jgi:hypothetical protein